MGSLSLLHVLCDRFASRFSGSDGNREFEELLRLWLFLFGGIYYDTTYDKNPYLFKEMEKNESQLPVLSLTKKTVRVEAVEGQ